MHIMTKIEFLEKVQAERFSKKKKSDHDYADYKVALRSRRRSKVNLRGCKS